MSSLLLRPYLADDLEPLLRLLRLNTPNFFAREEEIDFRRYLEREVEDYWVCVVEGEVVAGGGINYGFEAGQVARLSWDLVHPQRHGQGLGRKLVHHRLRRIRQRTEVRRVVVRTSQLAQPFYAKQGFGLKQIKPDYWAAGLDLYVMERALR